MRPLNPALEYRKEILKGFKLHTPRKKRPNLETLEVAAINKRGFLFYTAMFSLLSHDPVYQIKVLQINPLME